jgi:hypothetical protein
MTQHNHNHPPSRAHLPGHGLLLASGCLLGFALTLVAGGGCHDDDVLDTAATTAPLEPAKDAITKTTEVGPV